jgi:hypothetical protein
VAAAALSVRARLLSLLQPAANMPAITVARNKAWSVRRKGVNMELHGVDV